MSDVFILYKMQNQVLSGLQYNVSEDTLLMWDRCQKDDMKGHLLQEWKNLNYGKTAAYAVLEKLQFLKLQHNSQ